MPIHYRIEENNLQEGTFYARVIRGDTVTLDDIIPNIASKTSLTGTTVKSAVGALVEEVIHALASGHRVMIDDLVSFTTSLSGSYETNEVVINRDNANLKLKAQGDRALANAVQIKAAYQRNVADPKRPIISSFFDVASGAYDRYTPGSIVRLKGENLHFNPRQQDEGVFLLNGESETRLTVYSANGDKKIDALIPNEIGGSLTITVRARYTESGKLRISDFQRPVQPYSTGAPL